MTRIIASLSQISAPYDAVFCDLWGCLHDGQTPFPAAVSALQGFRAGGGKVLLLTNAPRPKSSVVKQLDAMGLPRDAWDDLVSSGDASQFAMLTGAVGRRVFHIGAPKDEVFFTDFADDLAATRAAEKPIELVAMKDAQGIVCTGLKDDATEVPEDYRATFLLAKFNDLPMLCANPDIVVDMGESRLYCAGALAQLYQEMGGKVLYFGKPHPPIYDLARRRLAALGTGDDPQILAIGDGISTDVQGALAEDIDTLFITGGINAKDFGTDSSNPSKDLLESWLREKMLSPNFALGHLR